MIKLGMTEFLEEIRDKSIYQINVWAGAGISVPSPSSLPRGSELSRFIFDEYMKYGEDILSKWNACNKIIQQYIEDTHEYIRPEVAVSCVTRMPNLKPTRNFFEGLSGWENIQYNYDHYLLALFVHSGGKVYTTNFDMCIEHIYEEKFHEKLEKEILCRKKVIISRTASGGGVYHLHGTYEYSEEAGASIESVMKGFDKEAMALIRKAFENSTNLFVGYSFSDDYDLNNIFQECRENTASIFVCSHEEKDERLYNKVKTVCGKKAKVFHEDTEKVLKEMVLVLGNTPEEPDDNKKVVSWKQPLMYPSKFSEDYKLLYAIELMNQMHISYKKISKNIWDELLEIDAQISNELGKYIEILQYNLLVNSAKNAVRKGKNFENKFLKKAFKNRMNYNPFLTRTQLARSNANERLWLINEKLNKGEILRNEDHEIISGFMRMHMVALVLTGNSKNQRLLKRINDSICGLEYNQGEEVYMFAARKRYKYLLSYNEDDLSEALKIYYDVGNLEGVISSLIAGAVVKSVKSGKRLFRQREWRSAKELVKETGICRYKRQFRYLLLADSVKHFPLVGPGICKVVSWICFDK